MTPAQQHFWDILSLNPERLSHSFAKELVLIKDTKKFHKRADEHLSFILSNCNDESVARTLKTWLCTYNLPIEPIRLSSMNTIQERCGHLIMKHAKTIKSY